MREFQALAGAGQVHRVFPDHVGHPQALYADRAWRAGADLALALVDGLVREAHPLRVRCGARQGMGEPVEFDMEVERGATVTVGQAVGWIEGFKAVTDLFCPMAGVFGGSNPVLGDDITLIHSDTYGRGWIYGVDG